MNHSKHLSEAEVEATTQFVRGLICAGLHMKPEDLPDRRNFYELGADSVDTASWVAACEKEFDIIIANREPSVLDTPADMIDMVIEARAKLAR